MTCVKMSTCLSKCGHCLKSCIDDIVLTCNECEQSFHATPRCTKLSQKLIDAAETYKWSCPTCKRCEKCKDGGDEQNMIFCDSCDRGYHAGCLKPILERLPDGQWKCPICIRQRREVSKLLLQRAQRTLKRRHSSSSAGAVKFNVKQEPLSPPAKLMKIHKKYKAALEKRHSIVTQSNPDGAARKGVNRNIHESCPITGCNNSGHLSVAYAIHSFKEACPIYHNLSADELKEFNGKKVKLEDFKALKSNAKQEKLIADLVRKRNIFDASLRDKMSKNSFSSLLNFQHTTLEPSLDLFASDEDIALFRMAQISAAEDMEKNSFLRNRPASSIKSVRIGSFDIQTVNASCYPDDVKCLQKIFVCHFCLKYLKSLTQLRNHQRKCTLLKPPGKLVYKKKLLHVWLVDGATNKIYCQNLCLLAKLFLDHKTLYYDVEPFDFYVLTENVNGTHRLAGYFSKEKDSMMNCNLSCILVLPPYQCKGYGKFLIELSYVLSKSEDKIGSPEHPLSDMGLIAYRGYWREKITEYLNELNDQNFSVRDLSQRTAIHPNDIVSTLQYFGMVKYWRGEYWILKHRDSTQADFRGLNGSTSGKKTTTFRRIDTNCLKLDLIRPPG